MTVSVRAYAPVRICDVGGWSDTWFASHGRVCNIAVNPGVHVEIHPHHGRTTIRIGTDEPCTVDEIRVNHPLIAVALAEIPLPSHHGWQVSISTDMPPGCATGTSAAVAVALLSGLAAVHGNSLSPQQAAQMAHMLETTRLGLQSGIQDQIGAAFGGINDIVITQYPDFHVTQCPVSDQTRMQLNQHLQLWYLGRPHQSSKVHEEVIQRFETVPAAQALLDPLRDAATAAIDALSRGDLDQYGVALQHNTRGQQTLHPALICEDAQHIIDIAQRDGALGWKVNGAGGDGGSVSILWADIVSKLRAITAISTAIPNAVHIPITISMAGVTTDVITEEDL